MQSWREKIEFMDKASFQRLLSLPKNDLIEIAVTNLSKYMPNREIVDDRTIQIVVDRDCDGPFVGKFSPMKGSVGTASKQQHFLYSSGEERKVVLLDESPQAPQYKNLDVLSWRD